MYVKGLPGKELSTNGDEVIMGLGNRSFLKDYAYDYDTYWSYWHPYFGGSVEFDVDVSDTGCACAAGVYLVELDNDVCRWDAMPTTDSPACSSVELIEASTQALRTGSYPCMFGSCEIESQCSRNTRDLYPDAYGPGSTFMINTNLAYHVKAEFWANVDATGAKTELDRITITLSQDGRDVVLEQDCPEVLDTLKDKLNYNMAMGISTFALPLQNEVSGSCAATCAAASSASIKNIVWLSNNSINDNTPEPETLVWGGAAETLTSGECGSDCAECRLSWYDSDTTNVVARCYDNRAFVYGNVCPSGYNAEKCMTGSDQLCHESYPHGASDRFRDGEADCRTVPSNYINNSFVYRDEECPEYRGLCSYGCNTGETCHNSYISSFADEGFNSPTTMCRCKPVA